MEAPLCVLCDERHWSRIPCKSGVNTGSRRDLKDVVKGVVTPKKAEIKAIPCPTCVTLRSEIERLKAELLAANSANRLFVSSANVLTDANPLLTSANKLTTEPANKVNSRKEYMRDYMARRRAKTS
jgi:hypothetical protein